MDELFGKYQSQSSNNKDNISFLWIFGISCNKDNISFLWIFGISCFLIGIMAGHSLYDYNKNEINL